MQKIFGTTNKRLQNKSHGGDSGASGKNDIVSTPFQKFEEKATKTRDTENKTEIQEQYLVLGNVKATPDKSRDSTSDDSERKRNLYNIPENGKDTPNKFQNMISGDSERKQELQKLRHCAEEGFAILQILAFFCGVGLIFSSILGFQEYGIDGLSLHNAIISFYSWIFGILIIALEGRILMFNISSVHIYVSNYVKILRIMKGRGLFYIFVGSFHSCLMTQYSNTCGAFLVLIGLITFISGLIISKRLKTFRRLSKKEIFSQEIFDFYDIDKDGYVDIEGFRDLMIGMRMKLETLDEDFAAIDENGDGLICYPEAKEWFDAFHSKNRTKLDGMYDYMYFY